jgi:DNA-binding NarL/FixJ family response regulator
VITLIIIDDHKIIRDALRALMAHTPGMSVIGEAADGRAGVELVMEQKPDVVLIDMGLPLLNGMEATRQLRERGYRRGIVMISMHNELHLVRGTRDAGADAYVLKEHAFEQLATAIAAAHRREAYFSPQLGEIDGASVALTGSLTPREREVLQMLAEGATAKEIAFKLKLSSKTVDVHRANLQRKLNVGTLADLTRIAVREGIAQL